MNLNSYMNGIQLKAHNYLKTLGDMNASNLACFSLLVFLICLGRNYFQHAQIRVRYGMWVHLINASQLTGIDVKVKG